MYKKILVPVDGSATSLLGLAEALKIAKESAGRIRLVHVVNEFIMDPGYSGGAFNDSLVDTLRQGGQLILDKAEKLVRQHGVEFETALLESIGGPAAELVVEQAKEWPADLIVMELMAAGDCGASRSAATRKGCCAPRRCRCC